MPANWKEFRWRPPHQALYCIPINCAQLRRTGGDACRADGAAVGLGASQARPWRTCCSSIYATITGITQIVADADSRGAEGILEAITGGKRGDDRWRRRRRGRRRCGKLAISPTGAIEVYAREKPVVHPVRRRGIADAGCRRGRNIPRTSGCATVSSTCGAKRCTPTSSSARRSSPTCGNRMAGCRLHRIFHADPDRQQRPKARATSWCPAAFMLASSMRCRRRRSSTSSC